MSGKSFITKVLGIQLASSLIARRYQATPLVALYHGVSKDKQRHGIQNYRGKHVSIEAFEGQIIWLQKHFEIVPLAIIEDLAAKREQPKKALCAITFDDGYKNNFEVAYPILKKYSVPATIFLTTGFIDGDLALWPDILEEAIGSIPTPTFSINWSEGKETYSSRTRGEKISADMEIRDKLKKLHTSERDRILSSLMSIARITKEQILSRSDYAAMSWDNILEMSKNNIAFGAHTNTHPILGRISKEEQLAEISLSMQKIEAHGVEAPHFAYPNGQNADFDLNTVDILKDLGFKAAWTTGGMRVDTIHDNVFELPRVTLDNTEDSSRFRALASNSILFLKKVIHK